MLDLRQPSGWLFLMLGIILVGLGVLQPDLRAPLSTVNVNLYAGSAMTVFGGAMLWLAHRKS